MSGKDLTNALHELMQQNSANVVPAPTPRGAAPKAKAAARLPGGSAGGNGTPGARTETAYADRLFWAQKIISTTDGYFAVAVKPIRRVKFTDAAGTEYTDNYAEPV